MENPQKAVLVQTEHIRPGQRLYVAGRRYPFGQLLPDFGAGPVFKSADARVLALIITQASAEGRLVVDQDYSGSLLASRQSGGHARGSAADDRHISVEVLMMVVSLGYGINVYSAQPGNAADNLLGEPPEPLGTVQSFVVEAHRHQPVEGIKDREEVALERGPSVLVGDLHSRTDLLGARTHVGNVVHGDQAVGASPRRA